MPSGGNDPGSNPGGTIPPFWYESLLSRGPADYTKTFGGPSHACPIVAGTVGLILSINPLATREEMHELLVRSAAKVDPDPWHGDGAWHHREYGPHSAWYGYDRVDTGAAVTDALARWSDSGTRTQSPP
ncbi:S8 family serine peptidase [Halobium palmae]|uniref:S8 family serine peptidase n=1 Tax=Halobium palmae TaxID=1776492 RepID=A0ABD5RXM3_9EURY